jgi:hypothetical protein
MRLFLLFFAGVILPASADVFVSTNGNDSWSGTLPSPNASRTDGPFASLARAQQALRTVPKSKAATVVLRGGTYYLPLSPTGPGALLFTSADSGDAAGPVTWTNYPGETPVVSGGVPIGRGGLNLTWKHLEGSLWQVQLPPNSIPFEYLFYNGERRLRSRLQSAAGTGYYMQGDACYSTVDKKVVATSKCNLGTYLRVAAEIVPTGPHSSCPSVKREAPGTDSKCLDRFGYNPADPIAQWINLNSSGSICGGGANTYPVGDVELTLFDAWTVDVMRISCVDTTNHLIYFTGPTKGNGHVYNFFGPVVGHRYIVENTRDAFNAARSAGQTGLWFLDRSTSPWTLNYLANKGENPNQDQVIIPQLQPVSPVGGSLLSATDLKYVTFRGITFEVDNYIPPPTGFNNDVNSDDTLPEAIDCESCQNVTFDSIVVRRTSASGILIASTSGNSGPPATHDVIQNSAFYDIGDCGIRIGHHPVGSDRAANVVQFVTVQNNIVQGYSRVFADGEGISQANGHDIMYLHNDITDGYHAGVSICLLGCPSHEANGTNNITQYNHIWNTTQGVTSDGGTLYYNTGLASGSGTGNKILNNLVHDTTDSSIIDVGVRGSGYGGEGIYLDIQSSGIDVENNVVYRVAASPAWISLGPAPGHPGNTFHNNILAYGRKAMFILSQPWPQGCANPTLRATVTNNLFYFDRDESQDFYVIHGCDDSCGLDYNKFINFQGNLYWRTDGGFASSNKAFHTTTKPHGNPPRCMDSKDPKRTSTFLTFAEWQDGAPPNKVPGSMGEDVGGTVTVNPGFGKAGKPSDFLLSKSPLAGFDHTKTNDTIRNAGRNHPVIMPPAVRHTFPNYHYTEY